MQIGDRVFEITIKGARELALAIGRQASDDWCRCCDLIEKGVCRHNVDSRSMASAPLMHKQQIEEFFRSDYYLIIMEAQHPGDYALQALRNMRAENRGKCSRAGAGYKHKPEHHPGKCWKKLEANPQLQRMLRVNRIGQEELAAWMHISPSTIANWMNRGLTKEQEERIRRAAAEVLNKRYEDAR